MVVLQESTPQTGSYEKRILFHVLSLNSWLLCSDIQAPTQDKRREIQSEG